MKTLLEINGRNVVTLLGIGTFIGIVTLNIGIKKKSKFCIKLNEREKLKNGTSIYILNKRVENNIFKCIISGLTMLEKLSKFHLKLHFEAFLITCLPKYKYFLITKIKYL